MNHFRYSNVLSQRDQRLKPLVYLNLEAGMENIQEIVQKQKNEQNWKNIQFLTLNNQILWTLLTSILIALVIK